MVLKYRLSALGWYNFETLVQTMLKVIIGPGVTSFGGSKDGGRDAFFEGTAPFPSANENWQGKWIFQVKYSERESIESESSSRVLGTLRNELSRILDTCENIQPDNYILITNYRMSASLREDLRNVAREAGLQGRFHSIDGREVCEFLDIHPHIRRSFPQLLGLADVDRIINKELYVRSEAFVSDWQPRLVTFVAVSQYFKALDILKKCDFVVIDGPPEVGKSFIGAAITLVYAADGYDIFFVRNPQEIFRAYDAARKQLYFADDAVGTINFDPGLGDYWGRDLPGIINKLSTQHKLIWTARSYILKEAIATTKIRENVDDFPGIHEVLVTVDQYDAIEKAVMLYNHAKHSKLCRNGRDFVRRFAGSVCYHRSFTPERVRQMIQSLSAMPPESFSPASYAKLWDQVDQLLGSPSERFQRAYDGLEFSQKQMLLAVLGVGSIMSRQELREAYEKRTFAF